MTHNDRLAQLLDSAMRPYDLEVSPRPQLSLFLRIDTLIAWYITTLDEEMGGKVSTVIKVCADMY